MNKTKTNFKCTNCNYTSIKWIGCCPECSEWGSLIEHVAHAHVQKGLISNATIQLMPLSAIETKNQPRILSGIGEWDRVVGGGLVPGSLIVITGDPGIGKSTLLLQVAYEIAENKKVFYFSTEESLQQLKQRALRLNTNDNGLLFSDAAELRSIINNAQEQQPDVIII